jgi:hypothetical protein
MRTEGSTVGRKLDEVLAELVTVMSESQIHRGSFDVDHPDHGRWKVDVRHTSPGTVDPLQDPDREDIE